MQSVSNTEKDWKLFKAKISGWQETYMQKLNQEYIELLCAEGKASEKFWTLEKRIKEDKHRIGVVAEVTRSRMFSNIIGLIEDEAITKEQLSEFSEELRDRIETYMQNCKE